MDLPLFLLVLSIKTQLEDHLPIQQVTKNSFTGGIDMIENDNKAITSDENNKVSEIKALHQLYKDKVLTKEEFEKEKKGIR